MNDSKLHYFATGHTSSGFANLLDAAFIQLNTVYLLQGTVHSIQSTIIENICAYIDTKKHQLEYIHCPSDPKRLDGLIIRDLQIGIINGALPNLVQIKGELIDCTETIKQRKLIRSKKELLLLEDQKSDKFNQAYDTFLQAFKEHRKNEKVFISQMDFAAADQVAENLIAKIFTHSSKKGSRIATHRFLGASTPDGSIDYVPNLTDHIEKRYLITGRAGSGKSTLLKNIAKTSLKHGFNTEIYHCGFDPKSVDMVIIRELSVALFDSSGPHQYDLMNKDDELIDLYKLCIKQGTDEKFAQEIKTYTANYKEKMKEAMNLLAEAKKIDEQINQFYENAIDHSQLQKIEQNLFTAIQESSK